MSDLDDKRKLDEIHAALVGNSELGHEGLVKKVDRHETWINNATVKFASIAGGAGVLIFLIELYFKK
jgi:hypothetical protein